LLDAHHHAIRCTFDVARSQMADFAHPQAGSIGKRQHGTVLGRVDPVKRLDRPSPAEPWHARNSQSSFQKTRAAPCAGDTFFLAHP
jgi:hypothetical protein